jgi:hypothetical protein
MSSCAASCSIYFHAVSSASATSASLQTDNVPGCCRSASAYFGVQKPSQLQQHRLQRTVLTHPGIVLCAAQRCTSSNVSPQLNSCFVLRHSTGMPHESTTPTSTPPRVPTRTHRSSVSRGSNHFAGHPSACSQTLRTALAWSNLSQPPTCAIQRPSPEITRLGSTPLKAHTTGSL